MPRNHMGVSKTRGPNVDLPVAGLKIVRAPRKRTPFHRNSHMAASRSGAAHRRRHVRRIVAGITSDGSTRSHESALKKTVPHDDSRSFYRHSLSYDLRSLSLSLCLSLSVSFCHCLSLCVVLQAVLNNQQFRRLQFRLERTS